MSNFLIKLFIHNNENILNIKTRNKYCYLSSFVGVFFNLILFIIKLFIGILLNSITIISDAFENLTDLFEYIIIIVTVKFSNSPSSKKYPFGKGRIEYIGNIIIGSIIMFTSIQLFKTSFHRMFIKEIINFNLISIIIMLCILPIKLWIGRFNIKIGNKIKSNMISTMGNDALSDCIISFSTIISIFLYKIFNINIDSYFGIVLSSFMFYNGLKTIITTINNLIGVQPDINMINDIKNISKKYKNIKNIHDVIINNYGYDKNIISFHAETYDNVNNVDIYDNIIDIEQYIYDKYNAICIIQDDPVLSDDDLYLKTKMYLNNTIQKIPCIYDYDDFRIIKQKNINLILLNIILNNNTDVYKDELQHILIQYLKKYDINYNVKIIQLKIKDTYI